MAKTKTTTAPETMTKGEWMQKYWRPCAAFMYITCCLADFAIFPIMFTVVQFWEEQASNDAFRQWVPITLQGGGLFHVSMCAVLGVSAYGRTQEKLAGQSATPPAGGLPSPQLSSTPPSFAGASNAGFNTQATAATSFSAPAPTAGSNFGSSAPTGGFGSPSTDAGFGATIATTASGKKIVPEEPQPLL